MELTLEDTDHLLTKQILIHWQNKPIEEASWEEELVFESIFPGFSLKSKTIIDGGGSDKERAKGEEEGKLKKKERDKERANSK